MTQTFRDKFLDNFYYDNWKKKMKKKPKIYIASKAYNANVIKEFRDRNIDKFECTSSWIEFDPNSYFVKHEKDKLWGICLADIKKSDFLILYSHDYNDDHNGALVELGAAMGQSKEIFEVGSSFRTTPSETSDVAYTYHGFYKILDAATLDDGLNLLMKVTDYWGVVNEDEIQ